MSSLETENSSEKPQIVAFEAIGILASRRANTEELGTRDANTEKPVEYTPGFVEWIVDGHSGEKVAAITPNLLRQFAILRQADDSAFITPDSADGSTIASLLLGKRDLANRGLSEYMVYDGGSMKGLNVTRLPDLVSRLEADIHDENKLYIRGIGPRYIQFLAEYCDAMVAKAP